MSEKFAGDAEIDDPALLTPQRRLDEVIDLLARGIQRLRRHAYLAPDSLSINLHETPQIPLEVCGGLPLHGADGLTDPRGSASPIEGSRR